jgi:hypothetical protein
MALSKKSLRSLIWTINATSVKFNSMITLTYPDDFPVNGATVKEDLRVYLQWLRRAYKTEVLWFLEFQTRGAPHFHILTQHSGISPHMRRDAGIKWVQRIIEANWFMCCFRGEDKDGNSVFAWQRYKTECVKLAAFNLHHSFWELEKRENGMRNYTARYAGKEYQKTPPKNYTEVGRFWGCSDLVRPGPGVLADTCEQDIRALLEKTNHTAKDWDVLPKQLFGVVDRAQHIQGGE